MLNGRKREGADNWRADREVSKKGDIREEIVLRGGEGKKSVG